VDLQTYARQSDADLELLTGALLIARDAYPKLEFAEYVSMVDEIAAPLRGKRLQERPLASQASLLSEHVYGHCGFRGNSADYYDPRNSYLNDVLERRLGIPITLAIVYVEVAKRVGVNAAGVAFPGHFLVRLDAAGQDTLVIDPFGSGEQLDQDALQHLLARAAGASKTLDGSVLAPAPVRSILIRMLMNLRAIYATRGDYARLLVVLDRIIDLMPEAATELRDRGLLWAKLGAPEAAIQDLRRYLSATNEGEDTEQVKRLLEHLERATRTPVN
jgi:regulator of sirC expression with transglutaminase-like and TPR domain